MLHRLTLIVLIGLTLFLVAGCSPTVMRDIGLDKPAPRKTEQDLNAGIRNYDKGNYRTAARELRYALKKGLIYRKDKVNAHKYLAFIYCVTDRTQLCGDEFKKALILDPYFELSPAEAGHPIWGPVYRRVRKEMTLHRRFSEYDGRGMYLHPYVFSSIIYA